MRPTLVDTGPLVALCDERDELHRRAVVELDRVTGPLWVCLPVLTEAFFLLSVGHLRRRAAAMFERQVFQLVAPKHGELVMRSAFRWLERYEEHSPDFADAFLVAWAESDPAVGVWTFDSEFSTVWRTLRGKKVRLVAG